jgi:hypothetical protein
MKLAFLMIVLTQPAGGDLSAAFVNTDSMEDCQARLAVVRSILESGSVPIEQAVCRASAARFEPFVHGSQEDGARYAYTISLDADAVAVEAVASCATTGKTADGRYCATSAQKLLAQ